MSKSVVLVVLSFVFSSVMITLKVIVTPHTLTTGYAEESRTTLGNLGDGPDNPIFQHYYNVKPFVKQ